MNIIISLPSLDQMSDIGVRLNYLSMIYAQANSISSPYFTNYMNLINNLIVDMVNSYLNNDITACQNYYDTEISTIESNKASSFENWEISIRDAYMSPPPFNPPPNP